MKQLARVKSIAMAVAAAFVLAGPAMAQAPAPAPSSHWYDRIDVSGSVDMNYDYNFNSPKGNVNQVQVFNNTSNSFQLPLAEINIASAANANNPLGFKISLGYGTTMNYINYFDKTDYQNVLQAYGTYLYRGYKAEFGKFVSPCGAEVIEAQNDYNYSRSLLFLIIPHTHTGVSVGRTFGKSIAGTLYLVNTPDHVVTPRNGKTIGYSINWKPTGKLAVTTSGFFGPWASETSWQSLSDTVVTYSMTNKLSLVGNYDYVHDRDANNKSNVKCQGFAGYIHYAMNPRSAVTLRGEITGIDPDFESDLTNYSEVKEGTLTYEYKVAPQITTRLELREDWGPRNFFYGQNSLKQNQTQIIVGNIITF